MNRHRITNRRAEIESQIEQERVDVAVSVARVFGFICIAVSAAIIALSLVVADHKFAEQDRIDQEVLK